MFFKMSNALLYSEPMRRLTTSFAKRDSQQKTRGFVFVQMLADSADNFRPYYSSEDISRFYDVAKLQAKIIWDILIELNVLRSDGAGYSCIEWMRENYIFGSSPTAKQATQSIDENAPASRETLLKVIRGEL